ncbi:hypothetical protein C8Q79DRAFT_1012609 [Trametes meyenii]|nr:hypothetical protein C8Q79DRAFT_1012609 [Trametes meyenii]
MAIAVPNKDFPVIVSLYKIGPGARQDIHWNDFVNDRSDVSLEAPQAPALGVPQGAPAPPFQQQQQQQAFPDGGWVGPVPGQAPLPPPPPRFFDPAQAWQHHPGGTNSSPRRRCSKFRCLKGFMDLGMLGSRGATTLVCNKLLARGLSRRRRGLQKETRALGGTTRNDEALRAPTPTPTTAPSSSPSSSGAEVRNEGSQTLGARHAAALATLRRFNPAAAASAEAAMSAARASAAPAPSPTSVPEPPPAAAPSSAPTAGPSSTPNVAQASPSALLTLIPLYDTSIVQPTRVPGTHPPYSMSYHPI